MTLYPAAADLVVALALGAVIGFERQWRQRLAGLRTNTLVSLGAATFVLFDSLYPNDGSPSRIAAQVVSGIGFLGAGIIFREGLNVRGLNTAATLWCSSAVGILAGSGAWAQATMAASLVVGVNLLLRPIVQRISRQSVTSLELPGGYVVSVVCRGEQEAHIRTLVLNGIHVSTLHLRRLESANIEGTDRVEVTAAITADGRPDGSLEEIVGRLSLEPAVTAARWRVEPVAE
jgi:putative Mg2+ transporter-C (MgtC) family protein